MLTVTDARGISGDSPRHIAGYGGGGTVHRRQNQCVAQRDVAVCHPGDIDHELGGITATADSMTASGYNLRELEQRLGALSIIESVNCRRMSDDAIAIDVVPMVPVARVFDRSGSYYINRGGKHLQASARYQIDVP